MPQLQVRVVVVTYNSRRVIGGLIDSLDSGLAPIRYELVVVDNLSSDGVVELVRRLAPTATVIQAGQNGGYAAGINAGAAHSAVPRAILVLNPDVRLHPGCVADLVAALDLPQTGIVVPKLYDAAGQVILSQRREPTVLRALGDATFGARRAGRFVRFGEVVTDPRRYESPAIIDWPEGSTLLISAECWERCGPWDESFFLYSEETDFALRARDAGFVTRYVPTAEATHLEGGSGSTPELWALLAMNRVRLFRKRHGRLETVAFWAAVVLREATRAARGKATSRAALRALLSPSRMRETPGPDSIRRRS